MENHSKVPDRGTTFKDPRMADNLLTVVEGLLISDDFAWEGVPESKSASFCGNVPMRGINLSTGQYVAFPVFCRTYLHQSCAEAKVKEKLLLMVSRVALSSTCYFAVMSTTEFVKGRISDRRYRLAKKLERPVWYVWVSRSNGLTFIFASDPITGRKEPTTLFSADEHLSVVANAMMLPGVLRIQSSRTGLLDDDHDDHHDVEFEFFGYAGDATFRHAESVAAEIALKRYKVKVDMLAPTRLDGGVTPKQWAECMQEAFLRIRRSTGPA